MTLPTVTADVHQALNAQLHFTPKRTFNLNALIDDRPDTGLFIIGPVVNLGIGIHLGLLQNGKGFAAADAVDVREANAAPLGLG